MLLHFSGGETSWPSQVYLAGIGAPSVKAELLTWIVIANSFPRIAYRLLGGTLCDAPCAMCYSLEYANVVVRAFLPRWSNFITPSSNQSSSARAARPGTFGNRHRVGPTSGLSRPIASPSFPRM